MNLKKYKHLFNIHLVASTSVAALFHFAFILAALFLWIEPPTIERDQPIFKELQVQFKNAPKQQSHKKTVGEVLLELKGVARAPVGENGERLFKSPPLPVDVKSSTDSIAFPQLK